MRTLVHLVVLAAVAGGLGGALDARGAPGAVERRCEPGSVPGRINGHARCLRGGMGCNVRDQRQYARYAFVCRYGVLSRDVYAFLHRRWHGPTLAPGSPCPRSAVDERVDFASFGVGKGIGPGPAYPIFGSLGGSPTGLLRYVEPGPQNLLAGSDWGGQKVLWFVLPGSGPVLVRGRQLDGSNEVRFDLERVPVKEMYFGLHTRDRPSETRLRAPGCYAYQIDGLTFSRLIFFEARLGTS